MDEPLSDYLDRLIQVAYVTPVRGVGYKIMTPTEDSITNLIEDEVAGRPVPIDDSADHFLLRSFDRARREMSEDLIPEGNGVFGSVYNGDIKREANEVCGEIPWRLRHEERCRTCGRSRDEDSFICSAGHPDIQTSMTADQPGKVREISRAIPLRKEDEGE